MDKGFAMICYFGNKKVVFIEAAESGDLGERAGAFMEISGLYGILSGSYG